MNNPGSAPKTDNLYFDIQADFGITKHMGGQRATRQLVDLCHVGQASHLLVAGCGIGSSLVYIAGQFGCRMTAIDLSPAMIAHAEERIHKHGLENQISLKTGDAQKLDFGNDQFDAVIAESVNAFLPEPSMGMHEYTRVSKPGGYVGINEVTWVKETDKDIEEYARTIMAGARFRNAEGWKSLLVDAGLEEIVMVNGRLRGGAQLLDEMQLTEMGERFKAMGRFMKGLFTNPAYRLYSRQILSQPGRMFQFTSHIGHGLYVGRKPLA
jgi:ubiquinone/menaquinone biosynthesis C-methylase UbiE